MAGSTRSDESYIRTLIGSAKHLLRPRVNDEQEKGKLGGRVGVVGNVPICAKEKDPWEFQEFQESRR